MKIFIDSDYKCHTTNPDGTLREIETDFFGEDKCTAFIEGYRFVPSGERWTRYDGIVFLGEMIVPWKPYDELDDAQREYERMLINDMQTALNKLGVTLDENVD